MNNPDAKTVCATIRTHSSPQDRWQFAQALCQAHPDNLEVYDACARGFLEINAWAYAARIACLARQSFSEDRIAQAPSLKECSWF